MLAAPLGEGGVVAIGGDHDDVREVRVVLQVLENQTPTDAEYAAKRDQIRDSLLQGKQQERFALFVSNLVDEMTKSGKIKRNQEELKALTRAANESGM